MVFGGDARQAVAAPHDEPRLIVEQPWAAVRAHGWETMSGFFAADYVRHIDAGTIERPHAGALTSWARPCSRARGRRQLQVEPVQAPTAEVLVLKRDREILERLAR
jgi:hypothetical protein